MKNPNVALVGNPNSGKSSVFNVLTGLRQTVSNFPGVTVDKKVGSYKGMNGESFQIMDLPGLYSLYPTAKDDKIVVDILANPDHEDYPDLVVYVADTLQIDRHFLLATQIIDLGIPLIFVANMSDIAKQEGVSIDVEKFEKKLGAPVLLVSARTGEGIEQLKKTIEQNVGLHPSPKTFYRIPDKYKSLVEEVLQHFSETEATPYQALLLLHHSDWLTGVSENERDYLKNLKTKNEFESLSLQVDETMARYHTYDSKLSGYITKSNKEGHKLSQKIDNIITHRLFGPIIFFSIMFLVFQALFAWASYPMDWIESVFGWMGNLVQNALGDHWYADLLTDGIIAGLAGVMVFIPQIFILFLLIAVLEEIGYMSRAVYMFDRLLRAFGLNGRSIVALISSGACAIPAIMSTRTIGSWKERLNTIMVSPLISCSARIPVYVLLIAFIVPQKTILGVFNLQGIFFMGVYLVSIIAALGSAYVFKKILKTNESSYLLMELPHYKKPMFNNVFITIKNKLFTFIWEAGKVIFVISIVLWFLASYGPKADMQNAELEAIELSETRNLDSETTESLIASKKLEASYAGHFGKIIEPAIKPLGFDWKIGIALLTSFAAREVFVGTMATIYAVGSEDEVSIRNQMATQVDPATGSKVYTPAVAMSLLVFYLFAMQCMSTLAITKRETNSWKWPIIQFTYMTVLAYLGSLLVYQLMS